MIDWTRFKMRRHTANWSEFGVDARSDRDAWRYHSVCRTKKRKKENRIRNELGREYCDERERRDSR